MKSILVWCAIAALIAFSSGTSLGDTAVPVSPADITAQSCPTFSWASADGSGSYRIEVYEQQTTAPMPQAVMSSMARPVRIWEIAVPALTLTPSSDQCLKSGIRYIWYVRGADKAGYGQWSEGMEFQVDTPSLSIDQRDAISAAVKEYLASAEGKRVLMDAGRGNRISGGSAVLYDSAYDQKTISEVTRAGIKAQIDVPAVQTPAPGLIIDQTGQVGIGTSTPLYQLDVLGTFGASGDSTLAKVTVSGRFTQSASSTTAGGYSKFTDTATGGTGLTGEANTGSAAWGLYGRSDSGIGVNGYSNSATGYGGQFTNGQASGKALRAIVNGTEVAYINAGGIHSGPAMTGTPLAFGSYDGRTGTFLARTSNLIVEKSSAGQYLVSVAGEYLSSATHVVFVTSSDADLISYGFSTIWTGKVGVYNYRSDNFNLSDGEFSIMIMKL